MHEALCSIKSTAEAYSGMAVWGVPQSHERVVKISICSCCVVVCRRLEGVSWETVTKKWVQCGCKIKSVKCLLICSSNPTWKIVPLVHKCDTQVMKHTWWSAQVKLWRCTSREAYIVRCTSHWKRMKEELYPKKMMRNYLYQLNILFNRKVEWRALVVRPQWKKYAFTG